MLCRWGALISSSGMLKNSSYWWLLIRLFFVRSGTLLTPDRVAADISHGHLHAQRLPFLAFLFCYMTFG